MLTVQLANGCGPIGIILALFTTFYILGLAKSAPIEKVSVQT